KTRRRSSRSPAQSPESSSWSQLQAFSFCGPQICFTQPSGKQRESGNHVDQACGNPHDQAAELLVLERRQAPGGGQPDIRRVPNGSGDGEQCAQYAAVNRRGEEIKHG